MNKPTLLGTNHTWEPHTSNWQRERARGTIRPLDYARPSDHDPDLEVPGLQIAFYGIAMIALAIVGALLVFRA